jgi:hypothetical protein
MALATTAMAQEVVLYRPTADEPLLTLSEYQTMRGDAPVLAEDHYEVVGATENLVSWSVTYLDGSSSVGFGTGNAEGATRRATLNAVLAYISSALNEGTNSTIDVEVQVSQTDGTGALASAGTFFFLTSTYNDGFAPTHIQTGTDPLPGTPDISVTVDFGYTWNSDTGPPAGGEFDLYTVLVHEITHGLGILGTLNQDGTSALGSSTFSTYASFLYQTGTGTQVLSGTAPPTYALAFGDLDAGDNTIDWRGPIATSYAQAQWAVTPPAGPPIYTPNTWASGSSIGHWQDSAPIPGGTVMRPAIAAGTTNREFEPFEIAVFQDLGYTSAVPAELSVLSAD